MEDNEQIPQQLAKPHTNLFPLLFVSVLMFIIGVCVGYILFADKNQGDEATERQITKIVPTQIFPQVSNAPSNTDNTSAFEVACSEKNLCEVTHKDAKSNEDKRREIDLSQLGWDVALLRQYTHGKNLMFYNPDSDQIIIPLTVAPGGIAGNKPEATLPDPPFNTAIYSTTFSANTPLTKLYSNTASDFQASGSLFDHKTQQLFLTQIVDSNLNSQEIIWSFKLDSKTLQKFVEVNMPPLSESGTVFMDLQLSGNKIIQRVEPNGGPTSSKAKIITIDINTKEIKIEDTSWR